MSQTTGLLGRSAVIIFIIALFVFTFLNPDFSLLEDYVSKLGAKGEPNATWFNLFGFLLAGIILAGFGLAYGKIIKDRLVGILLAFFGLGFAFTSVPIDMEFSNSPISKAHILAITLGLACWLTALAKIGYNRLLARSIRLRANITAILLVSPMIGYMLGFWSMPVTHRLVFVVVFGWTAVTAIGELKREAL